MDDLKPCPFCGGPAAILDSHYSGTGASGMETPKPYAACVRGCVEMKPIYCDNWQPRKARKKRRHPSYSEATAEANTAWNTRASDPRVEQLEAENAKLRGLLEQAAHIAEDYWNSTPGAVENADHYISGQLDACAGISSAIAKLVKEQDDD